MDYALPSPSMYHYPDVTSLSTATVTVSGMSGSISDPSGLNLLVTPSISPVECYSGSGVHALALFEHQVCHQWVKNFEPDEGAAFTSTFQAMRSTGTAYLTGYSWDTLNEMKQRGMLRWGEAKIQEHKIRNMKLPLDPGFDLSAPQSGPPIFVRQPDDRGKIAILNGNHRTAKLLIEGEATRETLYVLELASPEASFELLGVVPSARYTNPSMPWVNTYTFTSNRTY